MDPKVELRSHRDPAGNLIHHFDVPQPHGLLAVTAASVVETYSVPTPIAAPALARVALVERLLGRGVSLAPAPSARSSRSCSPWLSRRPGDRELEGGGVGARAGGRCSRLSDGTAGRTDALIPEQ